MSTTEVVAYRDIRGMIVVARTKRENNKYEWKNPASLIAQPVGNGGTQLAFTDFLNFSKNQFCILNKSFIETNFIEFEPDDFIKEGYKQFEDQSKAKKAGIQLASANDMNKIKNIVDIQNKFKK